MLSSCMNITQSYVSLFFWLGSCQIGLKIFHWERKFCLFLIWGVFSILEVYIYLNSVLLVFWVFFLFFLFFFFFFSPPRGQDMGFETRNACLVRFSSQKATLRIPSTRSGEQTRDVRAGGTALETRGRAWARLARARSTGSAQPGTHAWPFFTPDFLI